MVRHITAIAVLALAPAHAWAQQCTNDAAVVIDAVYEQLLVRSTTNNEGSGWEDQLKSGKTVREIVRQVARSPEHLEVLGQGSSSAERQRAAARMYDHLLGRRANREEVGLREGTIAQQGHIATIDDIISSPEYTKSFGDWRVPGTNVRYCPNSTSNNADTGWNARGRDTTNNRFDIADRNRDGRLTVSEWDDTRQAFLAADRNRDNVLTREEFNAATGTPDAVGTSGTRAAQFDQLDRNRNNRIERNEWRESGDTFNWLDRNGDGWLSRGEVVGRRNNQ